MRPFVKHKRLVPNNLDASDPCEYFDIHFDFHENEEDSQKIDVNEMYIKPCDLKLDEVQILDDFVSKRENANEDIDYEMFEVTHIAHVEKILKLLMRLNEEYNHDSKFKTMKLRGYFLCILAELFEENDISGVPGDFSNAVTNFMVYTL